MLFYRSNAGASDLSLAAARGLSLSALIAYPAGALILDLSDKSLSASLAGYALILSAFICAALLMKSSLQRIVAEQPSKLDEYELQLRSRAMNLSYGGFTALALIAIVYAAIASDHGGWIPVSYEQFNGLFWGVFLYAVVVPVAVLSWVVDESFETER